MRKKKDLQVKIIACERRVDDLDDAMEGRLRVTRRQMTEMIYQYTKCRPTNSEIIDPEIRWLAMMQYMADTISELNSLKEELAAMESKSNSQPLPMIPFFDNEAAEDERRFVSCYVEWRCAR